KVLLASGQVLWQGQEGMRLSAGAGSDGRTTVVAAADGTVVALDDQRQEKWTAKAPSEVAIPPVVGAGVVIVRSSVYRVLALDAATVDPGGSVHQPGPSWSLKADVQMISVDGLLISRLLSGKLMIVDTASGSVQWEGTVSVSQGATDLDRITEVVGA